VRTADLLLQIENVAAQAPALLAALPVLLLREPRSIESQGELRREGSHEDQILRPQVEGVRSPGDQEDSDGARAGGHRDGPGEGVLTDPGEGGRLPAPPRLGRLLDVRGIELLGAGAQGAPHGIPLDAPHQGEAIVDGAHEERGEVGPERPREPIQHLGHQALDVGAGRGDVDRVAQQGHVAVIPPEVTGAEDSTRRLLLCLGAEPGRRPGANPLGAGGLGDVERLVRAPDQIQRVDL
jgi:hypothetical protein